MEMMSRLFAPLRFPLLGLAVFGALSIVSSAAENNENDVPLPPGLYAEIVTPHGPLTAELFFQQAPLTVASFVGLAEGTLGPEPRKPFFDGLTFHRVAPGFVIQGGDPLGTGEGGPGYEFPDEFVPGLRHDRAGILSMANAGPDTNGSQFFITLAPVNRLNYLHSVFGRIVRGQELLPRIRSGDTMNVRILRRGAAAESFRADRQTFDRLVAAQPRATPPFFDDVAGLLQADPPRAKIFNQKLANLARFTGLRLYVRLYPQFEPSTPDQTPAQFADELAQKSRLVSGDALVVAFAANDDWQLSAPGRTDLKLAARPAAPPLPADATAAARIVVRQRHLLAALNEVVDDLIFQLEASRSAPPSRGGAP